MGQPKPLAGTYEYLLEGMEGIAILTETHFAWVVTHKGRRPYSGETPTDAEKLEAISTIFGASAGTHELVGPSRVKAKWLYNINPSLVGREFTWEYDLDGDMMKYWVIQVDGTRGPMGQARRVSP